MIKKKLVSLAMAGTIGLTALASPVLSVAAAPSTVSEIESLISDLTSEENEVSNKLTELQNDITENEKEAEKLISEMTETEDLLEGLSSEIEELKVVIEAREAKLNEQARALQIVGESGNLVKFVLNADSLNDIVGRVDVVSTLISANKQTVTQQEEDKSLVEAKEKETQEKQEKQTELAGKLEANKTILEERKAEQESILAQIASEKAVAKEERSELIAQAEAAEQRRRDLEAARTVAENTQADTGAVTIASSSASAATTTNEPAPKQKTPAPAVNGGSVVSVAHSLTGIPYNYGGTTTAGFDCSGYTSYVFNQTGRSLPRTAAGQYGATSRISKSEAQPGDLVFFNIGGGINHVGIYLGGGNFIGSQTSTGVAVASINSGFWANKVAGFGR